MDNKLTPKKAIAPAAHKTYRIVEVTWVDAEEVGEVGWNDLKSQLKSAKKPCPTMRSVGYVLYQGETHISLISTAGTDVSSTLEKIPTGFIKEIRELN